MAVSLSDLLDRERSWSLDAFVAEVNRLLPEVVPDGAPGRAKAEVNARLVRHYATEGVLPKPVRADGEVRYAAEHLVRALALRRLLAEGYSSSVAGGFLGRHDDEALARYLLGELRLELNLAAGVVPVADAGPAAHAAAAPGSGSRFGFEAAAAPASAPPGDAPAPLLRRRSLEGEAWRRPSPPEVLAPPALLAAPAPWDEPARRVATPPGTGVAWSRYPLLDGLELHVREDFEDPSTPAARGRVRDLLLGRLSEILLEREASAGAPSAAVRPPAAAARPTRPSEAPPAARSARAARSSGFVVAAFDAPRAGAAPARLEVVIGDVTDEDVDVLVNSTNRSLFGVGGVDGLVHRRAGPELTAACRALPGLEYGRAVVTPGFRLPAARVAHVAVPPWKDGVAGELGFLDAAYRAALDVARRLAAGSIAFPAIGTGTYAYPVDAATEVAVAAVVDALARRGGPEVVRFVLRKGDGLDPIYVAALRAALGSAAQARR